ncbi:MAG TPA: trehalose-6-phosphate synthase [Gemmatales bacterium]|nr:trehalose-6-phosphate synthase [Gemmatales bacterium]
MWTKEALHELIQTKLTDYQLIAVANREPYIHRYVGKRIDCVFPASGMATALDPIMRACGGTWVGHGSGDADRATVDAHDHVQVPPHKPRYTLRRVWLTKEQEERYYYGLANEALWPLCHITFTRPIFDPKNWEVYREVNQLFAKAVLEEAGDKPTFVFIQDYHFALLPRMLKDANPNLIIAHFWHIPWPNRETFRAFPWKEELLDGLLGNDLLGFHIRYHCQNFLDTVDRGLEAKVDHDRSEITRGGKVTVVRPFPISIDYEHHAEVAASAEVESRMENWRTRLGVQDELIGIGIDRIDYTKGIPERLRSLDRFLELHPQWRGKLSFVQVGVPSRAHIPQYQALDDEIDRIVEEINWKWSEASWHPVIFLRDHFSQPDLMALHRLAHFCMVTSLHDGLNLVAKEFVSSRCDEDGVLILSQFTGAARELTDALLVNPFAVDELAEAIKTALEMPQPERKRRMVKMRETVASNNIYRWAGKVLSTLLKFDFPDSRDESDN